MNSPSKQLQAHGFRTRKREGKGIVTVDSKNVSPRRLWALWVGPYMSICHHISITQHSACATWTPHKYMLNEWMNKWTPSPHQPALKYCPPLILGEESNRPSSCGPQMGIRRKSPKDCFQPAVPFILFHVEVTLGHINSKQFSRWNFFFSFYKNRRSEKGPQGTVWRTSKDRSSKQSVQADVPRFISALK